jgi:rhombotail lipoprotein
VGLSFLPSRTGADQLDPRQEQEILDRIKDHFRARSHGRDIQIIPDGYLSPHGGFESLQQLARLRKLDVVALVSCDQV